MTKYTDSHTRRQMGAGGTDGGVGRFFLGLLMFIGGLYLLLSNIRVGSGMGGGFGRGMGASMYNIGGYNITSGFILIPLMFGIGMIFFNSKNLIGWFLAIGSMIALIFGVISNAYIRFDYLNLFELIVIFVLFVGGIGLTLSGLGTRRKSLW